MILIHIRICLARNVSWLVSTMPLDIDQDRHVDLEL